MKTRRQKQVRFHKNMLPARRRFVGLLAGLVTLIPLLPHLLSKLPGRGLSLHEADFYRRHGSGD